MHSKTKTLIRRAIDDPKISAQVALNRLRAKPGTVKGLLAPMSLDEIKIATDQIDRTPNGRI